MVTLIPTYSPATLSYKWERELADGNCLLFVIPAHTPIHSSFPRRRESSKALPFLCRFSLPPMRYIHPFLSFDAVLDSRLRGNDGRVRR
ncbi:MAG: hypothetical protein FWG81_07550 [Betaproteobacteria bacterium]|nr:hypothetical protein [Betaproteobacteria bacterium]